MNIHSSFRRRLVQLSSLCLTNGAFGNFLTGSLYKGSGKYFCAPGLNCYSCPAAVLSCPIGALQAVGGTAMGVSFYVWGFLLTLGLLMGRFVCGFLCPFGFLQELMHKIPFPKRKIYPGLRIAKYFVLAVFVIALPVLSRGNSLVGSPAFCEYICPAGTLEGAVPLLATHSEYRDAVGYLFALKLTILVIVLAGSMSVHRFFCKTFCPLGAIYGLFNRISLYRLRFDKNRCISCRACEKICPMEANPAGKGSGTECIMCGKCAEICPQGALHLEGSFTK